MYDPNRLAVILADMRASRDELMEITNANFDDRAPVAQHLNAATVILGNAILHARDAIDAVEKAAAGLPVPDSPKIVSGEPYRSVLRGERV